MEANKDYVFQLSRGDIAELARATRLRPGFCIRIDSTEDGVTIGVDEAALAQAINGFIRNGGASASAADCTSVSFDPPS